MNLSCHSRLLFLVLFALSLQIQPAIANEDQQLQLLQQPQQQGQALQQQPPPSSLHDIHGPVFLPEPVPYLLYIGVAVAVLLLLLAAWWWYKQRPKPVPPPIPPAVKARDELMRARELMVPDKALLYMDQISVILRNYIESRFTVQTSSRTTREFFSAMKLESQETEKLFEYRDELQLCLERCDMAKYAHQSAEVDHMQQMENSVLSFVNRTEETEQTDNGRK